MQRVAACGKKCRKASQYGVRRRTVCMYIWCVLLQDKGIYSWTVYIHTQIYYTSWLPAQARKWKARFTIKLITVQSTLVQSILVYSQSLSVLSGTVNPGTVGRQVEAVNANRVGFNTVCHWRRSILEPKSTKHLLLHQVNQTSSSSPMFWCDSLHSSHTNHGTKQWKPFVEASAPSQRTKSTLLHQRSGILLILWLFFFFTNLWPNFFFTNVCLTRELLASLATHSSLLIYSWFWDSSLKDFCRRFSL